MRTIASLVYLPTAEIHPHPSNPRKDLGDLKELAESIRTNGVLQNLTVVKGTHLTDEDVKQIMDVCEKEGVDPWEFHKELENRWTAEGYTVIIGHRRLAAAKLAGLDKVPCVVAEMDEKTQLHTMLTENMQRSDLTVYEQAHGFQMMLDLGETVDSIAAKTGFSATTVRRRVKMMELDQPTLKEVSSRQIAITDFDLLAQIEDLDVRNKCLADIGTRNFDMSVRDAIRKQKCMQNLPKAQKILRDSKAKKLNERDIYSTSYEQLRRDVDLDEWDGESPLLPDVPGQLYYYIQMYTYSASVLFYIAREKREPVRRTEKEIQHDKEVAETWARFTSILKTMYELRKAFAEKLSFTSKNASLVLVGVVYAKIVQDLSYTGRTDTYNLMKLLGVPDNVACQGWKALEAFDKTDHKNFPLTVYYLLGDSADLMPSDGFKRAFPKYKRCDMLEVVYKWLRGLGYEMSDEEISIMNGTHEVFQRWEEY